MEGGRADRMLMGTRSCCSPCCCSCWLRKITSRIACSTSTLSLSWMLRRCSNRFVGDISVFSTGSRSATTSRELICFEISGMDKSYAVAGSLHLEEALLCGRDGVCQPAPSVDAAMRQPFSKTVRGAASQHVSGNIFARGLTLGGERKTFCPCPLVCAEDTAHDKNTHGHISGIPTKIEAGLRQRDAPGP